MNPTSFFQRRRRVQQRHAVKTSLHVECLEDRLPPGDTGLGTVLGSQAQKGLLTRRGNP